MPRGVGINTIVNHILVMPPRERRIVAEAIAQANTYREQLKKLRADTTRSARALGYTVTFAPLTRKTSAKTRKAVTKAHTRAKPKVKREFPVKYRDPNNTANAWSGQGQTPRWLAAYIANGRTKDEFRVT